MQRNVVGCWRSPRRSTSRTRGRPRSDDDYGYDGLRKVLEKQLPRVKSLRYDIEYRNIRVTGNQAEVEVFLDGSFEIAAPEAGDRYRRVNDYHRFLLAETATSGSSSPACEAPTRDGSARRADPSREGGDLPGPPYWQ